MTGWNNLTCLACAYKLLHTIAQGATLDQVCVQQLHECSTAFIGDCMCPAQKSWHVTWAIRQTYLLLTPHATLVRRGGMKGQQGMDDSNQRGEAHFSRSCLATSALPLMASRQVWASEAAASRRWARSVSCSLVVSTKELCMRCCSCLAATAASCSASAFCTEQHADITLQNAHSADRNQWRMAV